ncbi:MAG: anti-sigma factor [Myxococcota bacterium]
MSAPTDRLSELLTEELERPLTQDEEGEVHALLASHADWSRDDMVWAAAAATSASALSAMEPMPKELRERILSEAADHLPAPVHELPARPEPQPSSPWLPWSVAAAAALAAVVGWSRPPVEVRVEVEKVPPPVVEPSPAERLSALTASASTLIRWEASATEDPLAGEARGEFVWSPGRQEGFMVFEGLPANDPEQAQYQLWIFDDTRRAEHPVDGGVFDVGQDGQIVVPIHAAIKVRKPKLFAVTVEAPGGVVVSERKHIVVLGQPPQAL